MKYNKKKLKFISKFTIKIFEKKPKNGGTPAIEKRQRLIKNKLKNSKLKLLKAYNVLKLKLITEKKT